jgi:hypothetical protein
VKPPTEGDTSANTLLPSVDGGIKFDGYTSRFGHTDGNSYLSIDIEISGRPYFLGKINFAYSKILK